MSQSRRILVSSCNNHRSVLRYRPDRAGDHVVGADPSEGRRDAFGNRGGGGRGWARRRRPVRRFSRSRSLHGQPSGMVGTLRIPTTSRGTRTLGGVDPLHSGQAIVWPASAVGSISAEEFQVVMVYGLPEVGELGCR